MTDNLDVCYGKSKSRQKRGSIEMYKKGAQNLLHVPPCFQCCNEEGKTVFSLKLMTQTEKKGDRPCSSQEEMCLNEM